MYNRLILIYEVIIIKKFRLINLLIAVIIILSIPNVSAARLDVIYQKVTEQVLSDGVTQTNYKMLATVGWINANVIKADLSKKYLDMRPIFSDNGTSNRVTVNTLAKQNNSIAAVNSDFFNWGKDESKASPIGLLVRDGKLLSSPANNDEMAALFQGNDKLLSISYPTSYTTITAPNGKSEVVKFINKYDPLDNIVIYDNTFNKKSLGSKDGICEAVVENGILKEIRKDMEPFDIPNNTYVITFLTDFSTFMLDNFKVGDKVVLDISLTPNLSDIKNAVGGGTQLVTEGQPAKITHKVDGIHPRTAAGIDKTGKILYLITVDGRGVSRGISLEALTEFMITLGIYDGINLDGGGSTMMATRPLGQATATVANVPSEYRPISNAISIFSNAPKGKLLGITTKSTQETIFNNTSCKLTTLAYDEYYNPIEIDKNAVNYSVSGVSGSFQGNIFKPTSSGLAKITANYGGVSASQKIIVLGEPNSLKISPSEVDLNKSTAISVTGKDKDGYSAQINLSDLKITLDKKIAVISGDKVVKNADGSTILTVSLGEVKTNALVSTDLAGKKIKAPNNVFIADYLKTATVDVNDTFTVFGDVPQPTNLFQNLIMNKSMTTLSKYQNHFFVGDIDKKLTENAKGSSVVTLGFGDKKDDNSHYIWLNNRDGGLRATAPEQWKWLIEKVSNTDKNNVFIFLPKDVFGDGFTDSLEADAFFEVLNQNLIQKGKNCFVFANGTITNSRRINGVRYITTGGIVDTTVKGFLQDMAKTKYVTVTVNASSVNYDFKNVF